MIKLKAIKALRARIGVGSVVFTALGQAADATTRTRIATMIKDSMKFLKKPTKLSELNKISSLASSRASLSAGKGFEIIKNLNSGKLTAFTKTALGTLVSDMWKKMKLAGSKSVSTMGKVAPFITVGFGIWDVFDGATALQEAGISSIFLLKSKQLHHRFSTTIAAYKDIIGKLMNDLGQNHLETNFAETDYPNTYLSILIGSNKCFCIG